MIASLVRRTTIKKFNTFLFNYRAMSSGKYLVEDSKFSFLKDLGLNRTNKGVYNGEWTGNGEVNEICFIINFILI